MGRFTWRFWRETEGGLGVTYDGDVYLIRHDETAGYQFRRLGPIESADVPEELAGELAELADAWADAFDPAEEALAAWARSR